MKALQLLFSAPVSHMSVCPRLTVTLSLLGVAISTYAKYCYHKLQKAALTGAKKVHMLLGEEG